MPDPSDILRTLLAATLILLLGLAWFTLARRRLTVPEYLAYGLLALALPGLGPFLVIAFPPRRRRAEIRRRQTAAARMPDRRI